MQAKFFIQPATYHRGFTIVELMVAVFIAGLIISFINLIFQDTTRAVRTGLSTSEIITDARGASTQIEADLKVLVGPQEETNARGAITAPDDNGGILVIVNQLINAHEFIPPNGELIKNTNLRSDQLLFFRERTDANGRDILPIAPETSSTYGNDFATGAGSHFAEYVKVWYGHAIQTETNGEDPINSLGNSIPFLGDADGPGGDDDGINAIANNWILARHAVLLVDEDSPSPTKPDLANIHADNAMYFGSVTGYGIATTPPDSAEFRHQMRTSLTDVAGQVLGAVGEVTGPSNQQSVLDWAVRGNSFTSNIYNENAMNFLYFAERLRVNPEPYLETDTSVTDYDKYQLNSWQVGQMHPIFLSSAADFIVEFAGDYFGDELSGTASTGADIDYAGPYDTFDPLLPDGQIDRHASFSDGVGTTTPGDIGEVDNNGLEYGPIASSVKWYTSPLLANFPGGPNGYDSTKPLTFAAPENNFAPYVDATTARNILNSASTTSPANVTEAAYVWRHDDEATTTFWSNTVSATNPVGSGLSANPSNRQNSLWPYMLRIRYRALDSRGSVRSTANGEGGIWFEHIVKVNRP